MTDSSNSQVKTLKIHLLRKPITQASQENGDSLPEPSSIYVWGYYDWVIFEDDSKYLHDLYLTPPKSTAEYPYEEQILCAYTREQNIRILEDDNHPLFVITEIRLDEVILNNESKLAQIKEEVKVCFDKNLGTDGHVDVLDSLGYSDLIVVSLCHSYEPVYKAIIELRSNPHTHCKSTYSIYGIKQQYYSTWDEENFHAASIFISLKTKLTLEDLKKKIREKLNQSTLTDTSQVKPSDAYKIFVFPIFGKYDACIYIERNNGGSIKPIARLFYDPDDTDKKYSQKDTPLNESSEFYRANINYTRTHWYLDIPGIPSLQTSLPEGNVIESDHTDAVSTDRHIAATESPSTLPDDRTALDFEMKWKAWEFIACQTNELFDKACPESETGKSKPLPQQPSLNIALRDLLRFYWQIEHNETANSILCDELSKLFDMLLENIICSMISGRENKDIEKRYKEIVEEFFTDKRKDIHDVKACKMYDHPSLEKAITLYSELLQNRVQATRMVLEAPIYNYQFINASTKIYLAYYNIVENIENLLNSNRNGSSLNFFTTMHHADEILSQLLFSDHTPVQRIIPIRIDKKSFFSPRESIPKIVHEIGHFATPNPEKKNRAFLEANCSDIARTLFLTVVIEEENTYLFRKIRQHWNSHCVQIIDEMIDVIQKKTEIILSQLITQDECENNDIYHMDFRVFCKYLKLALRCVFSPLDNNIEKCADKLVKDVDELDFEKTDIEAVASWIVQLIYNGKDIDMPIKFWHSVLEQVSGPKKNLLLTDMIELAQHYKARQRQFDDMAEEMSKNIIIGLTHTNDILTILQNENSSPDGKKHLTEYIFKKRLNENTQKNAEFLKSQLREQMLHFESSLSVEMLQNLFDETGADLFMKNILALDLAQYGSIFNFRNPQSDNSCDAPPNRKDVINQKRRAILEGYFYKENKVGDSPSIQVLEGIDETHLVGYLRELEITYQKMIDGSEELKNFRNRYKQLLSSEENITNDINFFQAYWSKGR